MESEQSAAAGTKELEEAMLVVSIVVARLEEIYNVEVLCYEFQADGIWHHRDSYEGKEYSEKYHFWSAIAAEVPYLTIVMKRMLKLQSVII